MAETISKPQNNLMTALIAAQAKVEAVKKDSRNEFHKYDYASAESVLTGARQALDACGLAVFQAGWEFTELGRETIRPANGGETIEVPLLGVAIAYEVHHAESGESGDYRTVVPVREEKGRPMDKALFGALTEGLAYFLRGLLLIPRADAETPSARDDSNFTQPKTGDMKLGKPPKAEKSLTDLDKIKALLADWKPTDASVKSALGYSTVKEFVESKDGTLADALAKLTAQRQNEAQVKP